MHKATLLICLLISVSVFGQVPVRPDSTFNATGRKVFSLGGSLDFGHNVAVQPDGKILMTGATFVGQAKLGVCRMNADGSYDASFGTAGISLISLGPLSYQGGFEPRMVLQPDGRILICGFSQEATPGDDDMLVCRLLANGSLDPSFGNAGKTIVNMGAAGAPDAAYAITTDAGGNVYACGATRTGSTAITNDLAIIKLTSAGVLDPSFSGDGKLILDLTGSWDFGYGIAVRSDGKIIVTGYAGLPADIFAIRLLPNGSYDAAFGTGGKVTVDVFGQAKADEAWGMNMTSDGKILIVGDGFNTATSTFDAVVIRLTADGALDPAFSSDGKATFSISNNSDVMRNILIQPDGRYLVSGDATLGSTRDFAVMRLNTDGTLDLSFNSTGKYTLDVTGQNKDDIGYGMAIQQDGRILLSGNTTYSSAVNEKYSLVRLIAADVQSSFIASSTLVCNGSQVQFTSTSMGSNLSYLWTFQGGSPATSTQPNPSVTYSTPGLFDVKLVVHNSSFSDSLTKAGYISVIAVPAAPAMPSGQTSTCNSLTYTYTSGSVLYADSYLWSVTPSSAGFITGNETSATFSASPSWTGSYTVKVNATNQCGSGAWSPELSGMLNYMPAVFMLQGSGSYCQGSSGATLSLSGSEAGINYQLTIEGQPTGAVLPGTGSALSWNNLTTEGFYSVTASASSCSQQMAGQVYVIEIVPPVQPSMPTGPPAVCNTIVSTYSVNGISANDLAVWTLLPANAGQLSPSGSDLTVTWNSSFSGSATLSVHAQNECGVGPESAVLTIIVKQSPVPVISGQQSVCKNWTVPYLTTANAGSSYAWIVTGGTIISGAGTSSVSIRWDETGVASVGVTETNALGCSQSAAAFPVTVELCVGMDPDVAEVQFSIYPNPVTSKFTIQTANSVSENYDAVLYDATGRMVASWNIPAGEAAVRNADISRLTAGYYLLKLRSGDELKHQIKLIKH